MVLKTVVLLKEFQLMRKLWWLGLLLSMVKKKELRKKQKISMPFRWVLVQIKFQDLFLMSIMGSGITGYLALLNREKLRSKVENTRLSREL